MFCPRGQLSRQCEPLDLEDISRATAGSVSDHQSPGFFSSGDKREQGKVYFHIIDVVKLNRREQACVTQAEELLYRNSSSQVPCAHPFLREEGCRRHRTTPALAPQQSAGRQRASSALGAGAGAAADPTPASLSPNSSSGQQQAWLQPVLAPGTSVGKLKLS